MSGDGHKHIPRYTAPDGKKTLIQPRGTPRHMGYQFYSASMEGHIDCKSCGKKLELADGMPSTVGGARAGYSDFFRVAAAEKAPRSAPDPEKPKRKRRAINRDKGPVLHINTMEFLPDPDEKGPLVHPADLADRERIVIRTVQDLDKYRRESSPEKLDDTMVVFNKIVSPLVIADVRDPKSLARLNKMLREEGRDEVPCLLRATIPSTNTSRMRPNVAMDIDAVRIESQRQGVTKHHGQLQVFVNERDQHHANWQIFWGPTRDQTYWIMGVARQGKRWLGGRDGAQTAYDRVNISVTRPDQVMYANIENEPVASPAKGAKPAPSGL
jgi:hypothetical protein